jgi:hypothetical protein
MSFMEPTRKHGDDHFIGGQLIAVEEGIGDHFNMNAVLGETEAPLTLPMELRGKVDGAMQPVVEEDVS